MGSYAPSSWEWSINIYYLKFFCTGSLPFLLTYLFIQYFIYINIDSWIFVLSFRPYNSMLIYLFVCVSLIYSHQCAFFFSLLFLSLFCVEYFLIFWHYSQLHTYLVYSYVSPRISYFSKKPWLLLLENGRRNQDSGAKCACFYWGIIQFRPSQLTELGNKCICTVLYKYIIYILYYLYNLIYINKIYNLI